MKITPKLRYRYMVQCSGLYYQGLDRMQSDPENGKTILKFSRNRSDGKKFDSINAAREVSGKIGGSRIVRVDLLNGDVDDVLELMKEGIVREWKGASA